ncbi:hypothetical protein NDN08_004919 [Rhodosorus marinus]|uniref:Mitochondrial carrier protein n=1 Tax=Rhodosorus marinus TaxID=101924 RepID=A0AAV8UJ33_9RHOD|nr:hypothetical protein NDN08_004919 [Rhodosorus marinus]
MNFVDVATLVSEETRGWMVLERENLRVTSEISSEMEAVKDILAGTIAGAFGILVGQPLDVMRIRAQTTWAGQSLPLQARIFRMVRQEGLLAFYKGVLPPMVGAGAQHAALFLAYGSVTRFLNSNSGEDQLPSLYVVAAAGAAGGAFSSFVTAPVELLKVRQQVLEARGGSGMLALIRDVVASEGVGVLMSKGLTATIGREVIAYGCFFVCYEYIQRKWATIFSKDPHKIPLHVVYIAGGVSGVLCWLPSYPFDVVKSKLQVESKSKETMISCAKRLFANEGPQGFFRGFMITAVRSLPLDGLILVTYTFTLRQLNSINALTN